MSSVPQGFIDVIRGLNAHSGERVARFLCASDISDLWRYVYHHPDSLTEVIPPGVITGVQP